MIRVVSLSPAIDVTYELAELNPGQSHRVQAVHKVPGGKGVNVARILQASGQQVKLVLPLGGESGAWIASELAATGITLQETPIAAETRTCVTLVGLETTVVNEPAAVLKPEEFDEFLNQLFEQAEVTVFSGSVPNTVSENQLQRLFATLRDSSQVLVVDTSGPALLLASAQAPDLIKPNREEALSATGETDLQAAVEGLLKLGARRVLASDGVRGALLTTTAGSLRTKLPEVAGNPTGAGDAMVAIAARQLLIGASDRELLAQAVAAGSLAAAELVAGVIDFQRLEALAATAEITG